MTEAVKISIASADDGLCSEVASALNAKGFAVNCVSDSQGLLGTLYADPPQVMLVDLFNEQVKAISIINMLRSDIYFSTIPIIGIIGQVGRDPVDWLRYPLDDFIVFPFCHDELFQRIMLAMSRIKRVFDNNPLTRLPGNTSIQNAVNEALGKPMAVCYIDINNFKPYNDVYGFSHGDEVIRMLARIMYNAVRENGGGFSGHIGGDDFVCIVHQAHSELICKTIIANYDKIVLDLFDEKIKQQGYYLSKNRKGLKEQIPLLSISIAVVPTDTVGIDHFARISELAAELKSIAKLSEGSTYIIDKRRQ